MGSSGVPTPRRARLGVSLMFFTNGVLFAALLPRYPEIKATFSLTNSAFGLVVVAFPIGALLAASLAGRVIRRFGTLRTNAVGSVALAGGMAVAGVSADAGLGVALFVVAMLVAGATDAVVDAAQNVQGVLVEQWRERSVVNSFHALWSIGAATGGLIGAALELLVPAASRETHRELVARFAELTAEAYPTTPQETAAMFDAEDKMVVPLIKKLQIKPE